MQKCVIRVLMSTSFIPTELPTELIFMIERDHV